MSKPSPAPEPTMEEILASIRRIISDGDEMAATPPPPPPPPAPQRSAAAPVPMRPAPAAVPKAEEAQDADLSADEADIFDLTDAMVAKSDTLPPDFDFDSIEIGEENDRPPGVSAEVEPAVGAEPIATHLVEPDVLEFGADEAPAFPEAPRDRAQARQTPEAPLARKPSPEQRVAEREPPGHDAFEPAPAAPAAARTPAREEAGPRSPLMSPETDDAVTAAFGRLADTILSRDPKTLEDLVKEMLRPMLKDWLDDNLPVLVERLVREEIERVSRGKR